MALREKKLATKTDIFYVQKRKFSLIIFNTRNFTKNIPFADDFLDICPKFFSS